MRAAAHQRGAPAIVLSCVLALAHSILATPAQAVPSFARQTGLDCTSCHLSWPELTPIGRRFKLGGYTLSLPSTANRPWVSFARDGEPPIVPLAAFVQVSETKTRTVGSADAESFTDNATPIVEQASVFLSGRIADHLGVFSQWTYDGVGHHAQIDNTDLRLAGLLTGPDSGIVTGLTANNNPTVSDIYNTTPVWGFPFASSSVAANPIASTLIDGSLAQQVAGMGAYAMLYQTLYLESAIYRTAHGILAPWRAGVDPTQAASLAGSAPYWRAAMQHEWNSGMQSAMIGAYGLEARKYPQPDSAHPSGPSDAFHDLGLDVQYQFIGERHRVSLQATTIRERQGLDATFASAGSAGAAESLRTTRAKVTYYFDTRYGATLAAFRTNGSADAVLYAPAPISGSASGSPQTAGTVVELDWLPWRDRRFALQYTAYRKFNGAASNYDGFGRNSRDNDTLFLLAWLAF